MSMTSAVAEENSLLKQNHGPDFSLASANYMESGAC